MYYVVFKCCFKTVDESNSARVLIGCKPIIQLPPDWVRIIIGVTAGVLAGYPNADYYVYKQYK